MTAADLDRLEQLEAAAKPSPWYAYECQGMQDVIAGPIEDLSECYSVFEDPSKETCQFTAALRNQALELIALARKGLEAKSTTASEDGTDAD